MDKITRANTTPALGSWSKLGLGTGTLASLGRAASLTMVNRLLNTLNECGANLIDTADSYGSGDCEILLGKALRGRASSFHVVTKAGYRLSNLGGPLRPLNQFIKKGLHRIGPSQNFSPTYLSTCLDDSLSRLQVEQVDAFLLHDPSIATVADPSIRERVIQIKQSGKAAKIGISSDNVELIKLAICSGIFDVIQTPANLLAAIDLHSVWRECAADGIQLVGNHIFSPATLAFPGVNREDIMRACAALMPESATLLCGTRNPAHFIETYRWVCSPADVGSARALSSECAKFYHIE